MDEIAHSFTYDKKQIYKNKVKQRQVVSKKENKCQINRRRKNHKKKTVDLLKCRK